MEYDHYVGQQLLGAVLHLATGIGGIKDRLAAVYSSRIAVLIPPNHRLPDDQQAQFDLIADRLAKFNYLSDAECSDLASKIFNLWQTYERHFGRAT